MRPTILYSGGCRFCRWVARTILRYGYPHMDIIPLRHPAAIRLKIQQENKLHKVWPMRSYVMHWRYVMENGYIFRDRYFMMELMIPYWLWSRFPVVLRWAVRADEWVKVHRAILSSLVSDGPAIVRINGKVTWNYENKD